MTARHEEINSLLGAYALHAVEPDEASEVEEHVAECPRCRSELADYMVTAPLLGGAGGEPPEGLWEQVLASIDQPSTPEMGRSVLRAARRDARRRRTFVLGTAVGTLAAAAILVLALVAAGLQGRVNHLQGETASQALARASAAAAGSPGHSDVYLRSSSGEAAAHVVVTSSGGAYLVSSSLPELGSRRTYQLWTLSEGRAVSLGVLGRTPQVVAFHVEPGMSMLMITAEPTGGVSQPDSPVLASASLPDT